MKKWFFLFFFLTGIYTVMPQTVDSTRNKPEQTQELNQFQKDSLAVSDPNRTLSQKINSKQTLGALGAILIITLGSYFLFYTRSKG